MTAVYGIILFATLLACGCTTESDRQLVDAAAEGDSRQVLTLLSAGANIEVRARDDWTPLTIAAANGHYEVVRILLEHRAAVNAKEGGGHTALFWAEMYEHNDVVNLLKQAGGRNR